MNRVRAGPRSMADLTAALDAWDKGPLSAEEMSWMRRVGEVKYRKRRFAIAG
jgi:hypothetical protein